LFRIPYRTAAETVPVLVCVLIEHQSQPDPRMPLRMLLYTVLYWEREWKSWEESAAPRSPLRLTPVVPIVLHTGKTPWRKHRSLAELMGGPETLRRFTPTWEPMFLDLAGKSPAEWLDAAGYWLNALALVRGDQEDAETFSATMQRILLRLELLADKDRGRWHDLIRFVLLWAIYRRPPEERGNLVEIANSSQTNAARQKEVITVSQTIADALRAEGKLEGQIEHARQALRELLKEKFQSIPDSLLERIEATGDLPRLNAALRSVLHMASLDDLSL
jgi:hypothetical protein